MNNLPSKKYDFHVLGMHCSACVLLIESELNNYPGVVHAKANLGDNTLEVVGNFGNKSDQEIAKMLTVPIEDNGYTLSLEKLVRDNRLSDFKIAVPIALVFLALFFILQKVGLINLVSGNSATLGTAFVIGIIASLSTCMAVVGGLLLSMSATFSKGGDKTKPQVMFHVGRLVSFFVLGGVIGVLGSAFTLSTNSTIVLNVVIALVMFAMGLNLLELFRFSGKLQPAMPKFISRHALAISKLNHSLTPLLVGIATFFLPCGFTQAMQIATLNSGGFLSGGLTMLVFALGTLPVLGLVSFGFSGLKSESKKGILFKTAGLVVIVFALLNLYSALVLLGVVPPILNF